MLSCACDVCMFCHPQTACATLPRLREILVICGSAKRNKAGFGIYSNYINICYIVYSVFETRETEFMVKVQCVRARALYLFACALLDGKTHLLFYNF